MQLLNQRETSRKRSLKKKKSVKPVIPLLKARVLHRKKFQDWISKSQGFYGTIAVQLAREWKENPGLSKQILKLAHDLGCDPYRAAVSTAGDCAVAFLSAG